MLISGGKVFDAEKGFCEKDLCFDGEKISAESTDGEVFDASGCYVIPGLIDLHFHGCVGEDFSDASFEGLSKMADFELSQGVTYICPAGMTLPEEQLTKICENALKFKREQTSGAELVGVNLEGPFLCASKKGAQNGDFLHDPDSEMLVRLQKASGGLVKLVTVAPEQPGGIKFVEDAVKSGINVSLGHTAADYETACKAFKAGARQVTHLFNAMPAFSHRAPGVVGAAFDSNGVMAELISDGVHIHESVVRAVFRLFGPERVILISDSLRAAGMPDGRYPFGGQEILLEGNRATIFGSPDTLAGSVSSLMGCLRQAVRFGIPLEDAVKAASLNPAKVLGIDGMAGGLEEGKQACAVVLDEKELSIKAIFQRGQRVEF